MPSFVFLSDTSESKADSQLNALNVRMPPVVPIGFSGERGSLKGETWKLAWHIGRHTPIDTFTDMNGGVAYIIGEAIEENSSTRLNARRLNEMVTKQPKGKGAEQLARYSGLYAWLVIHREGHIEVGSDPFGLFPVYYFQEGDVFGLSTALSAFHSHPAYNRRIDPIGLTRILIENGCSGSRTLEKGARRLNIAESLCWIPHEKRLETRQHRHPGKDAIKQDIKPDEAVEQSIELSRNAVRRHLNVPPETMLLSGGLDSRHILSLCHELGHRPQCLTIGAFPEHDYLCGKEVAKWMKLPWRASGGFFEDPQLVFRNELALLSLNAGFNGLSLWTLDSTWSRGDRCLNGLYLDNVYGPFWSFEPGHEQGSFEELRDGWANLFGVRYDRLGSLYTDRILKTSVDDAMHELYQDWKAMTGDGCEVSWQGCYRYRARPHLGGFIWKNAFHSWPATPALDVPLSEGIRTIPSAYFDKRWLQKATFSKLRPDLSEIPFASVSAPSRPFIKTSRSKRIKRKWKYKQRIPVKLRKLLELQSTEQDTRDATWAHARQHAMRDIKKWTPIFDKNAVDTYMRQVPVEKITTTEDGERSSGRRMLLGALCWLSSQDELSI